MTSRCLRIGIAGLGRAFTLMAPTFLADPRVKIVAAADPRAEARVRFTQEFAAPAYALATELCRDPAVDVVYIATPHGLHAEHTIDAANHGKHVLVEKPMAIALPDADAMIAAAERAATVLIVGHSHSFDAPIKRTRELIASRAFGAVHMISMQYYTDFLYRPRRPEEFDTTKGGGALFNQAAHQVDIARLLGGGLVRSVRAHAGAWDAQRPTEGAYAALLSFAGGAFASLVYGGYAHFDSDEWCDDISELGVPKDASSYGAARRGLRAATDAGSELALKQARNYGNQPLGQPTLRLLHQHFGQVLVSCERADLRPLPRGVMIYGDDVARLDPLPPPTVPRVEVIDELYEAIVSGRPPLHDGRWARATLEVCRAMLDSADSGREVGLHAQVEARDNVRMQP